MRSCCDDADIAKAVAGARRACGASTRARSAPRRRGRSCTAAVYDQLVGGLAGRGSAPEGRATRAPRTRSSAGHLRRAPRPHRGLHPVGRRRGRRRSLVDGRDPEGIERGYYVGPTLLADCTQRHDGRARGDLRPGHRRRALRRRRRGDRDRQRLRLRPLRLRVLGGHRARRTGSPSSSRRATSGINTAQRNHEAPFGGFKMSGVGRDGGDFGLHAYTEIQSIIWPG